MDQVVPISIQPVFITVAVPWETKWEYLMPVVAYITEATIMFDVIHGAN